MVLAVVTGWLDRQERQALAYLMEENRVLRRHLIGSASSSPMPIDDGWRCPSPKPDQVKFSVEFHAQAAQVQPDTPVCLPCRLVDATGGNKQQLAATRGNSQRSEVKAFKQQEATGSNSRQHAATRPKPRC